MGVKGLGTFVKDNRGSLCRSVQLESGNNAVPSPIVVDAWSIIFQLYLGSLPWTSGGEYLRFYSTVRRLIQAWRDVGLEPTFVFDGATPPEKHATLISRLQKQIGTAQLFYTTSATSRSAPSFSGDKAILPPFTYHTFVQAVQSLKAPVHFVPMGEADGMCVTIAERLGAYILSLDSDYLILTAGCSRMKGYCPLDMIMWIDNAVPEVEQGGEWSTAYRRSAPPLRQSNLLPPYTNNPTLILTVIPPQALAYRLRLPPTLLPLFASLCGNDYTPPLASEQFFESGLSILQRIEKVARIMREQFFSPAAKSRAQPGDQAVAMIKKVVQKLSVRPFISDQALQDLVDAMIESTFQYSLPAGGECCSLYPFCGELDEGDCQTHNLKAEGSNQRRSIEAYALAQRRGQLGNITSAWLHPDRVYLWQVLEDPSLPSLKASSLLGEMRRKAWEIADEGLGGMRWPQEEEDEDGEEQGEREGQEREVEMDSPKRDNTGEKDSVEEDDLDEISEDTEATFNGDGESENITLVDGDNEAERIKLSEPPEEPSERVVVEYLRQGSSTRLEAVSVALSPLPDNPSDTLVCLQTIDQRLAIYRQTLRSNTPAIQSLPIHYQPLVSILRLCILAAAQRTGKSDVSKWRRSELEAILRACIGTYAIWHRERNTFKPRKSAEPESETRTPLLTSRNSSIIAQLSAVMTDSHILAQALILDPEDDRTHLIPYVFFSGTALHGLLNGSQPSPSTGWNWSPKEQVAYDSCLAAVIEGIEGSVVGWETGSPKMGVEGGLPREISGEKKKKGSTSPKGKGMGNGNGNGGGRFDLLKGLTA